MAGHVAAPEAPRREGRGQEEEEAGEREHPERPGRPKGCWRCGPFTHAGYAKDGQGGEGVCVVSEVEEDGVSGWSQHKVVPRILKP